MPAYRIAFFEALTSSLAIAGIEVVVAAGAPDKVQNSRGDSANPDWLRPIKSRSLRIGSRSLDLSDHHRVWADSDAVIVGLVGSSVDTNLAVLQSIRGTRKVGLWGHVKSYVTEPNRLDARVESWQMHHADHVFAYTQAGADFAAEIGIPKMRISTLNNTIDTASLQEARHQLTDSEVRAFNSEHDLVPGKVLAFIGGLDESKRIDFLADALESLHAIDPDIKVLVGGQGSQIGLLNRAVGRNQVVLLGHVGHRYMALIGRTASAILSPGRIGLVAVEALILGLPVLTTKWPHHAPEVEYLQEGSSKITGPNDPSSFAAFVSSTNENLHGDRHCARAWTYPTLNEMVKNFGDGIVTMLESNR